MAKFAEDKAKEHGKHRKNWVGLVPFGLQSTTPEQLPRHYGFDLGEPRQPALCVAHSERRLLRWLPLGTTGMHDWTMKSIHLCAVRLQLMRLNTMPAMDVRLFDDVETLRALSESELRELGRLPAPMVRRQRRKKFSRRLLG